MNKKGIELRDYFAGLAMQAIITASGDAEGRCDYREGVVAGLAYDMADLMLDERESVLKEEAVS